MPLEWWLKVQEVAAAQGVDPYFAGAVAYVESNGWKAGPLGTGKNGRRFIGPMGLNRCFADRWDIYDPLVNLEVGVRALRGNNRRAVLRRYNAKAGPAYIGAVLSLRRQFHREAACQSRSLN